MGTPDLLQKHDFVHGCVHSPGPTNNSSKYRDTDPCPPQDDQFPFEMYLNDTRDVQSATDLNLNTPDMLADQALSFSQTGWTGLNSAQFEQSTSGADTQYTSSLLLSPSSQIGNRANMSCPQYRPPIPIPLTSNVPGMFNQNLEPGITSHSISDLPPGLSLANVLHAEQRTQIAESLMQHFQILASLTLGTTLTESAAVSPTGSTDIQHPHGSAIQTPAHQRGAEHCSAISVISRRSDIIGIPSLSFVSDGQRGIRLDLAYDGDLSGLPNPECREFFDGLRDKVSYVIQLGDGKRYSRQLRSSHSKKKQLIYCTHQEIVRKASEFTLNFIQEKRPLFHTYPAFKDWPTDANLQNFILVELRKISRASVELVFECCPSPLSQQSFSASKTTRP